MYELIQDSKVSEKNKFNYKMFQLLSRIEQITDGPLTMGTPAIIRERGRGVVWQPENVDAGEELHDADFYL